MINSPSFIGKNLRHINVKFFIDFVKHSVIPEGPFAGLPKAAVEVL